MRKTRAYLVAVLFGLCAGAEAGYYQVTYDGGQATIVGPLGTRWTADYADYLDYGSMTWMYGGSWVSSEPMNPPFAGVAGPGSVTCAGQVTVTFTWINNGILADTPPPYVVLLKYSSAGWSGDSGSCANGLGHPEVPGGPFNYGYGVSQGQIYELYPNPPAVFTRTITPSAYAFVADPPAGDSMAASAGIAIRYAAFPVEIKLTGVLNADTDRRLMIGQNLGAYINISGLPLGNGATYAWNVSDGEPFQSFDVMESPNYPDVGTVTPFTTQVTPGLFTFLRTPAEFNVTCTFYWPWLGQSLNLTENGESIKPWATTDVAIVSPEMVRMVSGDFTESVKDYENPDRVILFKPDNPLTLSEDWEPGIAWLGEIDTPDDFDSNGSNHGVWAIVQLVTPSREQDGEVPYDTEAELYVNGVYGLDLSFPYGIQHFTADGSLDGTNDNPSHGVTDESGYHYTHVLDSFDTFYFYRPPGSTTQYVTLKSLEWYWKAFVHVDADETTWEWDSRESAWQYLANFPPHPTWNYRHDTGNWDMRPPQR